MGKGAVIFLVILIATVLSLSALSLIGLSITGDVIFSKTKYSNASKVIIQEDVFKLINSRYVGDQDEFIYCIYGDITNEEYIIKEVKETKYSSNGVSTSFVPCNPFGGYLGTIHSHPGTLSIRSMASCELSNQDAYTFGKSGDELSGIICGVEKFVFFTPDELYYPLEYEVMED